MNLANTSGSPSGRAARSALSRSADWRTGVRAQGLGVCRQEVESVEVGALRASDRQVRVEARDRKSTRLNSSHLVISYAVFCLKKKKNTECRHDFLGAIHFDLQMYGTYIYC